MRQSGHSVTFPLSNHRLCIVSMFGIRARMPSEKSFFGYFFFGILRFLNYSPLYSPSIWLPCLLGSEALLLPLLLLLLLLLVVLLVALAVFGASSMTESLEIPAASSSGRTPPGCEWVKGVGAGVEGSADDPPELMPSSAFRRWMPAASCSGGRWLLEARKGSLVSSRGANDEYCLDNTM